MSRMPIQSKPTARRMTSAMSDFIMVGVIGVFTKSWLRTMIFDITAIMCKDCDRLNFQV